MPGGIRCQTANPSPASATTRRPTPSAPRRGSRPRCWPWRLRPRTVTPPWPPGWPRAPPNGSTWPSTPASPSASSEVERATGRSVGGLDALVTLGPGFVAWDGDDERLREVVASDVGRVTCLLYPARAEGPLSVLMPWLLQVAAETVAHGATEPGTARERAERSAARAFTGAAQQNYDSWNAHGQMLTDHPAWPALVEATMDEAVAAASRIRVPANLETLAVAAHGALAAALTGLGVKVVPGTGSQA